MEHYKSRTNDFFHFTNPPDDLSQSDEEEEDDDGDDFHCDLDDDRSCDFNFHHFRPLGFDLSQNSSLQNFSLMVDTPSLAHEELETFNRGTLVSGIDKTVKKLCDNLLYTIEGLSTRLSQLDGKTCQIDNSVDDLKNSLAFYHRKTDGKLRQLQDILQEVQDGVQLLREKHEIAETQLQLAKLQGSKIDDCSASQTGSVQQVSVSAPLQSCKLPTAVDLNFPRQLSKNQTSSSQIVSYYQPAWQTPESKVQQYHIPRSQQLPPSHQIYEAASQLPHFSQSSALPHMHSPYVEVTPRNYPSWSQHSAGTPYMPSPSYPSSICLPPSKPSGWCPTQELDVGLAHQIHRQPSRSVDFEFPTEYLPEAASFVEMHPQSEASFSLGGSETKPLQFSPIPSVSGSEYNHTRLPRAKVLPHALPTASSVDDAMANEGNGNKAQVDEAVEKVTSMGFRRDLVKATVKKLTANGQLVNVNLVLDKMMNNG